MKLLKIQIESDEQNFTINKISLVLAVFFAGIAGYAYFAFLPLFLYSKGFSAGEIIFNGRVDYSTSLDVDNSILIEGKNAFSITNIIPSGSLDMVYLDWIEVVCPRKYRAYEDNLAFSLPENNGTKYIINGFKNNDIEVFDITNGKRITNTQISPDGSSYSVSFEDSRPDDGRIYYAAAEDGFLLPAAIDKVEFENLRNDYLKGHPRTLLDFDKNMVTTTGYDTIRYKLHFDSLKELKSWLAEKLTEAKISPDWEKHLTDRVNEQNGLKCFSQTVHKPKAVVPEQIGNKKEYIL